jgi:3-hydroxybutyryl-CoA dehydrogenase
MAQAIRTVGVVGLGVMGFDIAFLYAMKGYRTVVHDTSKPTMDSLPARTERMVNRLLSRKRISESEIENVRSGMAPVAEIGSVARADLVTEAVSEAGKIKMAVYSALREAGFNGILTTNTSSFTRAGLLGTGVYDSARFATTHFFNPVLYTRMIEVVKGDMDEERYTASVAFLEGLGRTPVLTKDISGFVSNSVLMYYAVTALWLLERGASIEAVDQMARELGLLPPFISFDSWKPSIVEDVTQVMYELRGDRFLRSCPLLTALARGNPSFYLDQKPNPQIYRLLGKERSGLNSDVIRRALRTSIHVAAARVVELGEDPQTVDTIAVDGIKIPKGPLQEIDTAGPAVVIRDVRSLNEELGETRLEVPEILTVMAEQEQRFFLGNGHLNPWVNIFVGRRRPFEGH